MEAVSVRRVTVELLDHHGRVASRVRVDWSPERSGFTIGRSAQADVVLDDAYAAGLHATVEVGEDGRIAVTDLGSVNGVVVAGRRIRQARDLVLADGRLRVGHTRMRVRTWAEQLAAERVDRAGAAEPTDPPAAFAWIGAAVCLGFVSYFVWLEAPRDFTTVFANALTQALIIAGVWTSLWALLTRVIRGSWRWGVHATIFFGVAAALLAIDWLLDLAGFALTIPHWQYREVALIMAGLAFALYWHLTRASAIGRGAALLVAVLLPALGVGSTALVQARAQMRDVNYIAVREKIFPPGLRITQARSLDEYFAAAAELKAQADRRRRVQQGDDVEGDDASLNLIDTGLR